MERALITGVAGFIGSHLAAELLRQGWLVTGVDTRSPANDPVAAQNLAEFMRDSRFQFASADVVAGDLAMLLEGVRAVFHLAALPGVRRSWGDRFADYLTCNVLGTQRLLETCAMAEVPQLVFASSSSVYGPTDGTPSRESDPLVPMSPYGVSKLAAERLCLAYASRPGAVTRARALPRAASFAVIHHRYRQRMKIAERHVSRTARVRGVPHHTGARHCTRSPHPGFGEAAVLIIDSLGETCTTSISSGRSPCRRHVRYRIAEAISDPASLGYAYGAVTAHLGWRRGDEEGTVMALAALGDPARFRDAVRPCDPAHGHRVRP